MKNDQQTTLKLVNYDDTTRDDKAVTINIEGSTANEATVTVSSADSDQSVNDLPALRGRRERGYDKHNHSGRPVFSFLLIRFIS